MKRCNQITPCRRTMPESRLIILYRCLDNIAIVKPVKSHQMFRDHFLDCLVVRGFRQPMINLAGDIARAAVRFHPRAHRRHPGWRARDFGASGIDVTRLVIFSTLPVDISEMMIKNPRRGVCSNTFFEERYCRV